MPQDQSYITGARGPGSPFARNQIVNVPGIGPVRLSDYGPDVKGIDIPVTSPQQALGNAVNRVVNINGRNVQLSGYTPKAYDPYNLDPTGGGNTDTEGRPIVPYTGDPRVSSPGDVTENPFIGGTKGYPIGFSRTPQAPQAQTPSLNIPPYIPTGPEPTRAPANVPTNELVRPTDYAQYRGGGANIPINEVMAPTGLDQYRPAGGANIPTSETMAPFYQPQYYPDYSSAAPVSAPPTNVPTPEGMLPTGPNEYLPGQGANIPTYEGMTPEDLGYLPSTAGANIPTDESMIADLAPDAFRMPETMSYPDGQGGYKDINASTGEDVPTAPGVVPDVTPAGATFPITWGGATGPIYGAPPEGQGFLDRLGNTLSNLFSNVGPATTFSPFGVSPSNLGAPGAGAFWSPPGGAIGGPLGQGSGGDIPWFSRLAMQGMRRGDPTLGLQGSAITDFAARQGKISVPGNIAQYYGANQAFTGTRGDVRDATRGIGGPNARAMSAA